MSERILITGGTGLAGSNIALKAVEQGKSVRALVRKTEGLAPLKKAGVEFVIGDVTDPASLQRAMQGVAGVVHTAAVLGGTWSKTTEKEFWAVNHQGTLNVLDAARQAGVARTVSVDTNSIYDWSYTITERSPIILIEEVNSPYVRAKRAAFYGGQYRAAALGQDIRFVAPGAIYGPGPFIERVLDPTSFSSVLLRGIQGGIDSYLTFPMHFTYVLDLAEICLRALDKGQIGRRYLALGDDADVSSIAAFCNQGAELAGSAHRVREIDPKAPDAPNIGTMRQFAERVYARPYIDNAVTTAALGWNNTPRATAIMQTIEWLRQVGKLPVSA